MVKVQTQMERVLQSRGYGVYPSLNPGEDEDLLYRALSIESKTIKLIETIPIPQDQVEDQLSVAEELINESIQLQIIPGSLEHIIISLNLAQLYNSTQDYIKSIEALKDVSFTQTEQLSFDYVESLRYKKFHLLTSGYIKLNDLTNAKQSLNKGLNIGKIPNESNVESNKWLNKLFDQLNGLYPNISITELSNVFENKNFIISFANHTKSEISGLKEFILGRSEKLLQKSKFPNSNELNNYELEEFIHELSKSSILKPLEIRQIIEIGISKTYQSRIILNSFVRFLYYNGGKEELISSFEVYHEYVHSYYVLNHSYDDLVSILQLTSLIISRSKDLKILNNFHKLLLFFYKTLGLEPVGLDFDIVEQPSFDYNIFIELRKILSKIWLNLSEEFFNLKSKNALIQDDKDEIIQFLKNSIYLYPTDLNIFQYSYKSSLFQNHKQSFKFLTKNLSKLLKSSINYFKSWHLFALILSIEENKEESFKIITFLNNEILEFIQTETNINPTLKQIFIEIKISQLAIVESLYGVEQALDSLPDLFNLYNVLFPTTNIKQEDIIINTHKKSKSLSRTHTLTKIKSLRHKPDTKPVQQRTQQNNVPSLNKEILQKIWLIASKIYLKLKLFEESEEAILEAENVSKPTSETHATLGLLTFETRPQLSLLEFESALKLNDGSLFAIIGLSNLIINSKLIQNGIFIDKKDRLAGIARCKLLLENAILTFEGENSSEVWWLLSEIYQEIGDGERFKESLWKSVQLEESRPVRDFNNV